MNNVVLLPIHCCVADAYEHVATVLPNVTRFEAGRRLLLQPGRGLLQALASQLRSPSELRRRGCAGALKNCCFSCEADGTADDIAAETEVSRRGQPVGTAPLSALQANQRRETSPTHRPCLQSVRFAAAPLTRHRGLAIHPPSRPPTQQAVSAILDVLCGITAKEEDAAVREALAEAVLCLARHGGARKQLWAADAPTLLQKGYEFEENPTVCACMEATAELFLADGFQPAEEQGGDAAPAAEGSGEGAPPPPPPGRVVHIEEVD